MTSIPTGTLSVAKLEELELSNAEIEHILDNLDTFSEAQLSEINTLVDELDERTQKQAIHDDLIEFCKYMQPDYIVGKHHRILADMLMSLERGEEDRLCVNIPPRHGKSQIISTYFPPWFLGRNPDKKVMMVSHTTDLAVDFGRKVRNIIAMSKFKEVFPDVGLSADSKSAGRWNTNHGGEFYACGIGSSIAGRGADLLVIDDPHSEQDVLNGNFEVFEKAYEWFTFGARTRLMPGGRVAIVQTRWHMDDLTGRLIKDMQKKEGVDQYHVVEFPAILNTDDGEKPLWPEFFDLEALHRTKASMPLFQWNAQFQQNPTSEEGSLIKREWWRRWPDLEPPQCEYIIMTLDAAAEKHNRADYTAITTWGVFFNEDADEHHIILINSVKDRYEFPELKKKALEEYKDWEPDAFIVEKKSAGTALYQEMRRMGVPVSEYTPHRGSGDKLARLNSVTDIVASGLCWVPDTNWAEELVEEVAAFPFGSHDDLVDTTVMALMRFRAGGFIRLPSDEAEEQQWFKRRGRGYY